MKSEEVKEDVTATEGTNNQSASARPANDVKMEHEEDKVSEDFMDGDEEVVIQSQVTLSAIEIANI